MHIVSRNGRSCPVEDVDVENGAGLLDSDRSSIQYRLRRVADVHVWQARLRKERHIHSHRHDAARQRSDRDRAVVVDWIADSIAERVRDRCSAHVEHPATELRRNNRFNRGRHESDAKIWSRGEPDDRQPQRF